MKYLILPLFLFGLLSSSLAQSVTISTTSNCFNPAVTVPFDSNINGRPAYNTTLGNLGGVNPVQVSVFWSGSQWQINVGGGTIVYTNSTNSPNPPSTGWQALGASLPLGTCSASDPAPTLSGDVTLPVELTSFHATQLDQTVILNWTTASEIDNQGFEIEKSVDGLTWKIISFKTGNGTSDLVHEYRYIDLIPNDGMNYYRLKQIDLDQVFEYSKVVAIDFSKTKSSTVISPNPFSEEVNLNISPSENTHVVIYDTFGKYVDRLNIEKNTTNYTFDLSHLKNGVYYFKITQNREVSTHKIIKI